MERCVWWVFIYPVAMHGPCGHVCAKVAPFTWLLPTTTLTSTMCCLQPPPTTTAHPNNNDNMATLPAQWTNNDNRWRATWPAQQTNGYKMSHHQSNGQTMMTASKPPHQPNGQTTTMDSEPPHQPNGWQPAGQWMCHDIQTVMMHVVVTVHKFRWDSPPSLTWEPRGHITIGDVETTFRFPFANNIAHPWSVPHITVASLWLKPVGHEKSCFVVRFVQACCNEHYL